MKCYLDLLLAFFFFSFAMLSACDKEDSTFQPVGDGATLSDKQKSLETKISERIADGIGTEEARACPEGTVYSNGECITQNRTFLLKSQLSGSAASPIPIQPDGVDNVIFSIPIEQPEPNISYYVVAEIFVQNTAFEVADIDFAIREKTSSTTVLEQNFVLSKSMRRKGIILSGVYVDKQGSLAPEFTISAIMNDKSVNSAQTAATPNIAIKSHYYVNQYKEYGSEDITEDVAQDLGYSVMDVGNALEQGVAVPIKTLINEENKIIGLGEKILYTIKPSKPLMAGDIVSIDFSISTDVDASIASCAGETGSFFTTYLKFDQTIFDPSISRTLIERSAQNAVSLNLHQVTQRRFNFVVADPIPNQIHIGLSNSTDGCDLHLSAGSRSAEYRFEIYRKINTLEDLQGNYIISGIGRSSGDYYEKNTGMPVKTSLSPDALKMAKIEEVEVFMRQKDKVNLDSYMELVPHRSAEGGALVTSGYSRFGVLLESDAKAEGRVTSSDYFLSFFGTHSASSISSTSQFNAIIYTELDLLKPKPIKFFQSVWSFYQIDKGQSPFDGTNFVESPLIFYRVYSPFGK